MEKAYIEVKNVSKGYGEGEGRTTALRNVSLTIAKGEFLTIIGESGSGKSSLLNMLGAIDFPDEGSIFVNEEDITKYKEKQLSAYRKDEVGFVFQLFNLINDVTALANVMIVSGYKDKEKAMALLDRVGLAEKANKYPRQLSGGQQQRVAVARALNKKGNLLLCDEPTGALDEASGKEVLKLLKEIHSEGKTVVLVTHTKEIGEISDRVITMKDGEIVSERKVEHPIGVDEVSW